MAGAALPAAEGLLSRIAGGLMSKFGRAAESKVGSAAIDHFKYHLPGQLMSGSGQQEPDLINRNLQMNQFGGGTPSLVHAPMPGGPRQSFPGLPTNSPPPRDV